MKKLYKKQRRKHKHVHSKQLIPLYDESYIICTMVFEEIFEDAIDKSLMKEYIKQAPEKMSNFLLCFSEISLNQAFCNVEPKENMQNIFGQNAPSEPAKPAPDSWIRRKVKVKKIEKKAKKKSKRSKRSRRSKQSKESLESFRPKISLNSVKTLKSGATLKSLDDVHKAEFLSLEENLNKLRSNFVVAKPVEIDYEAEGDSITKQRE
jgi:hypothetical protein